MRFCFRILKFLCVFLKMKTLAIFLFITLEFFQYALDFRSHIIDKNLFTGKMKISFFSNKIFIQNDW